MKHTLYLIVILAVAGLLAVACGGSAPPTPTAVPTDTPLPAGDPIAGQAFFEASCSACHGSDAKGVPNVGKNLTTSEFLAGLTDAEFVAFVNQGRPTDDPANTTGIAMPPKGGNPALSDTQLLDIVAYLRTIHE